MKDYHLDMVVNTSMTGVILKIKVATASTRGHVDNLGLFGNFGLK